MSPEPELLDEPTLVQQLWRDQALDPAYMAVMSRLCPLSDLAPAPRALSLGNLPRWICVGAGGQPAHIIPVTAAWNLLLRAFAFFDNVEDGDIACDDPRFAAWLNAALGLIFTASSAMYRLEEYGVDRALAAEVRRHFFPALLPLLNGQHQDLTAARPTLDEYWRIAAAKIGTPFGLACWTAARLAGASTAVAARWQTFGRELGVLAQIKDDLQDLWDSAHTASDISRVHPTALPVVYALSVLPMGEQEALQSALSHAQDDPAQAAWALQCIVESGAGLYLVVQSNLHYQRLTDALTELLADGPEYQLIVQFLGQTRLATL